MVNRRAIGKFELSLNDPKKTEHLRSLEGAGERLQLFKANLLEEGSFDGIVEGCEGVFHTASPFYHDVKDPQDYMQDPSLHFRLSCWILP
ncbi:hypothetical protein MLD38_017164 [Melastoma candidum]|uniref:Uncharacterized protein n=1 Tax=Melastoma candidum TaxID=119954 RepID=A0ACB9QPS0_9MYRT|nr:hypothetical protein MLD38_017164 [Melastoma candidum]